MPLHGDIRKEPFGIIIFLSPGGGPLMLWPGCVEGIFPDCKSNSGLFGWFPRFTVIQFSLSLAHGGAFWNDVIANFRFHGYGDCRIYNHRQGTTYIVCTHVVFYACVSLSNCK